MYKWKKKKEKRNKRMKTRSNRGTVTPYKFYNIGNRNHTVKYNPIFICIMCINVA